LKNIFLTVLLPLIIAVILRIFFLEIYKIPSSSMEPTLLQGDIILVSKMSYGARVLKLGKFLNLKRREYFRLPGWNRIRKGDVFVFNWPKYSSVSDSTSDIYGSAVVKRCYGMPGDCVVIKNEELRIKNDQLRINNGGFMSVDPGNDDYGDVLFPHDSSLRWTVENYGPLYVPGKGKSLYLSEKNKLWYKDVLLFENCKENITETPGKNIRNNLSQHIFNENYYFMTGDNFYNSQDSRYWGFVPEGNIIGKAVLVLFSSDPQKSGFSKVRWNRFLHKIKTRSMDFNKSNDNLMTLSN